MNSPMLTIHLDRAEAQYRAGETLSGYYRIDVSDPTEIRAVEISALWHTVGKGDEDLAVHYFQRVLADGEESASPIGPQRFATELPNSPLSYDGMIVKIAWRLRVRLFLRRGREVVAETPFTLGHIPPCRDDPEPTGEEEHE